MGGQKERIKRKKKFFLSLFFYSFILCNANASTGGEGGILDCLRGLVRYFCYMGAVGQRHRKGSANYDGRKIAARNSEKEAAAEERASEAVSARADLARLVGGALSAAAGAAAGGSAVREAGAVSKFTRADKVKILDNLLRRSYDRAMSEHGSPKDFGACLDVLARHDMIHDGVLAQKLTITVNVNSVLTPEMTAEIEKRLGVGGGEVTDI